VTCWKGWWGEGHLERLSYVTLGVEALLARGQQRGCWAGQRLLSVTGVAGFHWEMRGGS